MGRHDLASEHLLPIACMIASVKPAELGFGNGRFHLTDGDKKVCHGFANGCRCGCKPGQRLGSSWTQNEERN